MIDHIKFLNGCARRGFKLPEAGLCTCAKIGLLDVELLELFEPSLNQKFKLYHEGKSYAFWASDGDRDYVFGLSNLRITIVLFMAAMNNEL